MKNYKYIIIHAYDALFDYTIDEWYGWKWSLKKEKKKMYGFNSYIFGYVTHRQRFIFGFLHIVEE